MPDFDRKPLKCRLMEGGERHVGEEFLISADWVEEFELLRQALLDAVSRLGEEPWTVGEYLLEVSDLHSGRHLINVAAVYEEVRPE